MVFNGGRYPHFPMGVNALTIYFTRAYVKHRGPRRKGVKYGCTFITLPHGSKPVSSGNVYHASCPRPLRIPCTTWLILMHDASADRNQHLVCLRDTELSRDLLPKGSVKHDAMGKSLLKKKVP